MKGKSGRLALTAFTIAIAWGTGGCSFHKPPSPTPDALSSSPPPVPGQPHIITNLDTLATSNAGTPSLTMASDAVKTVAGNVRPMEVSNTPGSVGTVRHVGTERHPGQERLLNVKAAYFSEFADRLMDQVFDAMQTLEREDPGDRLELPKETRPAILTATMDANGQLKEIVLEQHSGVAGFDRMVIAACKQSLYAHNPPLGARTKDGDYKVRLRALIKNYASQGQTRTFKTYLGIALL